MTSEPDRYYGEHLKQIEYTKLGPLEATAIFERPDGSRFKRHRKGSNDRMVELPGSEAPND